MKHIELIEANEALSTEIIIRAVVESGGTHGVSLEEMRNRCRILDVLDANESDILALEDADFTLLGTLLKNFKFGAVSQDLLKICDGIENGKPNGKGKADG